MNNRTLLLTMNNLSKVLSISGDTHDGTTLTYELGILEQMTLLEGSLLIIQFTNGEIRIELTQEDLMHIKDEQGNFIMKGELR